jgi:3-polyprenyl-4-hydroxybenzoate decarboxylase
MMSIGKIIIPPMSMKQNALITNGQYGKHVETDAKLHLKEGAVEQNA